MKNFSQEGKVLEFTAPADVTSGVPVLIGGLLVVPQHDALSGAKFSGLCEGVVEIAKDTAKAFVEGEEAFWDDTAKEMNATAVGRYPSATAVKAADAADATGFFKLKGFAVPAA